MRFRRAFRKEVLTAAEIERRLYGAPLPEMNKLPPSAGALEAKEILNNLVKKEGTVMPDLQSALKNAIETWEPTPTNKPVQQPKEKAMPKTPFEIKNNVTRATFAYVKLHPGTTAAAACKDLVKQGFKESSITALMAQFVKAGLAVRDNKHGYRVVVDEYVPMKASAKYSKKATAKPAPKAKAPSEPQNEGIAALQPEATSKRAITTIIRSRTPEDILNDMNVRQAKELYEYLKQLFGG